MHTHSLDIVFSAGLFQRILALQGAWSQPHDVSNARLCQRSILYAVQYATTRAQLHDQVDVLIILKHALHSTTYIVLGHY